MTDKLTRLARPAVPHLIRSRTTTGSGLLRIVRRSALLVGAVAASVAIAGCGDNSASDTPPAAASAPSDADSTATTTPDGPHNDADVSFAEQVIPYQQQAITLGRLTDNSNLPQVKALGGRIATSQQRQTDELTGFLRAWNAPVPSTDPSTGTIHGINYAQPGSPDPASSPSPGMLSAEGLRQLQQSSGPGFDKQFLQTMIGQHKAVVAMARTELTAGQNSDVKALAGRIVKGQQSELSEMQTILVGPDFGHF